MEQKNRLLIVIAVTVLIAGAMFTSFGRSLFTLNTPPVELPSAGSIEGDTSSEADSSGSEHYQRVEITPDTVQNVIATLSRPTSYSRNITVETFWENGSSSASVQIWCDGGWTHTRSILPSGAIRHNLSDASTLYYWYEGSRLYEKTPANDRSQDLSQHIPTYETVLNLEKSSIRSASYVYLDELSCILAEVPLKDPDRIARYWIGVESGLLVSAEIEQGGYITYRMTGTSSITSCPSTASFSLPDGTVLHSFS